MSVPLTLGVKYALSEQFNVFAELMYRFTNTDHLDDVSGCRVRHCGRTFRLRYQSGEPILRGRVTPLVERLATHPERPTRLRDVAGCSGVIQGADALLVHNLI